MSRIEARSRMNRTMDETRERSRSRIEACMCIYVCICMFGRDGDGECTHRAPSSISVSSILLEPSRPLLGSTVCVLNIYNIFICI